MKGIQDTSSKTFRQLLGNGLSYKVPKFQRDYSWDIEQLDDLWQDAEAMMKNDGEAEDSHYMGYLVLQTNDDKTFKIIDGQQRLTTLSILILAALKSIKDLEEKGIDAENNKKRREVLHGNFIGQMDPVDLVIFNKLQLGRHNDRFFKRYLTPLDYIPVRGLNFSERLMKKCFEYFHKRIKEAYGEDGSLIASFIDSLTDKLFFTVILVNDDLNAFRVFETLNARGVQLSSPDLLKNYLLSSLDKEGAHEYAISDIEESWSEIIDHLGESKFSNFMRYYWIGRRKFLRKTELFRGVKQEIKTKEDVINLVQEMRNSAGIYNALQEPNDTEWRQKGNYKKIKEHLEELKIFEIRQNFLLLMTAYEKLSEEKFMQILRACSVISFRYNVIGDKNPNDLERIYSKIAIHIAQTGDIDKNTLSKYLKSIYPSDEIFEDDFAEKSFNESTRSIKKIVYILSKIEAQKHGNAPDISKLSIEHIMPKSYEDWGISEEVGDRVIPLLGNLTLLEESLNKSSGNKLFAEKKQTYEKSTLDSTKELLEYPRWDEDSIRSRQKNMAKIAKSIWSLNL
jgi:uncharacterized protein with ParB-like and HNH nuclease domain